MSDIRRYSNEQIKRVEESGEKAPDTTWYGRAAKNAAVAIPRTITDITSVAGMAIPLAKTGFYNAGSSLGLTEDTDLGTEMYGKEGIDKLQNYVQTNVEREFAALPEEYRTEANLKKLQTAYQNDDTARDILVESGPTLTKYGMKAGNAINDYAGLNRIEDETTTDDLEQLAASTLLTLGVGGLAKGVTSSATSAAKSTVRKGTEKLIDDIVLPGALSGTKTAAAKGMVYGATGNQALRYATDQPSVVTGDAFITDIVADKDGRIDVVSTPDFILNGGDPEKGLDSESLSKASMAGGAVALGLAALSGKANKLMTKGLMSKIDKFDKATILDPPDAKTLDVDTASEIGDIDAPIQKATEVVDNVSDELPSPTPSAVSSMPDSGVGELTPTLSRLQKLRAGAIDITAPITDSYINSAKNTFKTAAERTQMLETRADIERVIADTASSNIAVKVKNVAETGDLGLPTPTLPLNRILEELNKVPEAQKAQFEQAMYAKSYMDSHQLRVVRAEDELKIMQANLEGKKPTKQDITKIRAKEAEIVKLNDDTAMVNKNLTVGEARKLITDMEMTPQLSMLEKGIRVFHNNMLYADLKQGLIDQKTYDAQIKSHPNYIRMQEAETRTWKDALVDWAGHRSRPGLYGQSKGPVQERGNDGITVENPISIAEAMQNRLAQHVKYRVDNDATRAYVNAIKTTNGFGKHMREIKSVPVREWFEKGIEDRLASRTDIVTYTENGNVKVVEIADPEVVKALQFNAAATLGIASGMRKVFTTMTTGVFQPFFAITAPLYDDGVIRATKQSGRAYGMIDSTLRQAFPNSARLGAILDKVGDPTSKFQVLNAAFEQVKYKSIRELSNTIADFLGSNSAMANLMKSTPIGAKALREVAETGIRSYNTSIYKLFADNVGDSGTYSAAIAKADNEKFNAVDLFAKTTTGPLRAAWDGYKAGLDSLHNSARYAFFSQNVELLSAKYGGMDKIPQKELNKLVHETRTSSGDMTKSVGSDAFSQTVSVFPYANVMINATHFLGQQIARDPVNVGSRLFTGAVVPKLAAITLISAGGPGSELYEWYWNEIPAWQRLSKIPTLGPAWWMGALSGNTRTPTPNDIYLMPEDPSLALFTNTTVAMARQFGMFGGEASQHGSILGDMGAAFKSMTSIASPPLLALFTGARKIDIGAALTGGDVIGDDYTENTRFGFNSDMMDQNSVIPSALAGTLSNMFGISNLLVAINAGEQNFRETKSISKAFEQAFSYGALEYSSRAAEIPGTRELGLYGATNGMRRMYSQTQQRDRIMEVMDTYGKKLAPQLTIDNDKQGIGDLAEKAGVNGLNVIGDPKVKQMAMDVHQYLGKGLMKQLTKDRSEIGKTQVLWDASRGKMSAEDYYANTRNNQKQLKIIDDKMEDVIDQMNEHLKSTYGLEYPQVLELVGQSLAPMSNMRRY